MNDTTPSPSASAGKLNSLPVLPKVSFAMLAGDCLALPESLYDPTTAGHANDTFENIIPLIVAKKAENKFVIIDGCKRFMRNRAQGIREFACSVLDNGTDETAQGLIRIMLNRGRPRTLRETVYFIRWLNNCLGQDGLLSHAKDLGFTSKEIHETAKLVESAPAMLELVANGVIHLACVDYFAVLSEKERILFCETFEKLELSCQTQREFLEWLPEIAYTHNKTVMQILQSSDIADIIQDAKLNAPQKIDHLRNVLFSMRFPRYAKAIERWTHTAAKANPDRACVHFSHSPAFEKRGCEIKLTIKNSGHAKELFAKLGSVPAEAWDILTNPAE